MRRVAVLIGPLLACLGLACAAEPVKEPKYVSDNPLYAKVALDEKGSKVLSLVFDESGGTGKGYDTVYADLNFNGDFRDDEPKKATLERLTRLTTSCTFPPIDVDFLYSEKAKGVEKPCSISIRYYQTDYQRATRRTPGDRSAEWRARFLLLPTIELRDGPAEWTFSFSSITLDPAEKPEDAPLARVFPQKSQALTVDTMPDPKRKGYLGIQAVAVVGGRRASPSKSGKPVSADVQITNAKGKIVLHQNVAFNRMFFG